jgi:lysophospholipase L1-like esterase
VLWRLRHGEFDQVSPKVVVLMIGTNNVNINTPDEIAAGVAAIIDEVHQRSPQTKILLHAIFPRGEKPNADRTAVDAVNQRIKSYDGRGGVVTYIDIGAKFVGSDGTIDNAIMYDFLHPTPKGYEIWVDAMGPTLKRLLSK